MDGASNKKKKKVTMMVSPPQNNDAMVLITGQQDRNEKLLRENEVLRQQVKELEEIRKKVRYGMTGKYSGKNKIRKKDAMTTTDRLNCTQINSYLKNKLFPYIKFLPPKWMRYGDNKRSVCGRIMNFCAPGMTDPKTYWENMVCPMINEKWCTIRANVKESIRIQYLGQYIFMVLNVHIELK